MRDVLFSARRNRPRTIALTLAVLLALVSLGVRAKEQVRAGEEGTEDEHCPVEEPAICVRQVAREMQQRLDPLADACDHDAPFALVYLRVTEAIEEAVAGDVFAHDNYIADMDVVFADFYFDAYDTWHEGDSDAVPPAWRIALRAADRQRVTGMGNILLGLNAHIRRDLPFVVEELGLHTRDGQSVYSDYLRVNEVLRPVYPRVRDEAARRFDPTIDDTDLSQTTVDEESLFTFVREMRLEAWELGRQLVLAQTDEAREQVVRSIETNARQAALDIVAGFNYTARPTTAAERNDYCEEHGG